MAAVRGVTAAAAARGIERHPLRIDVGEHRPRAGHHDRQRRVRRRERRGDHLVAGADPERAERDGERIGAGADADRVRRGAGRGELALEGVELGPEHEPAALQHARDCRLHDFGVVGRASASGTGSPDRLLRWPAADPTYCAHVLAIEGDRARAVPRAGRPSAPSPRCAGTSSSPSRSCRCRCASSPAASRRSGPSPSLRCRGAATRDRDG